MFNLFSQKSAKAQIQARIEQRTMEAKQRRAVAAEAQSKIEAIKKEQQELADAMLAFKIADNELVEAMKAEANALAKIDHAQDDFLSLEDQALKMLAESDARVARLNKEGAFSEYQPEDVWGNPSAPQEVEVVEDLW